jgi:thioredoxin reductase (NADPH)
MGHGRRQRPGPARRRPADHLDDASSTFKWVDSQETLAEFSTRIRAKAQRIEKDGEDFVVHWSTRKDGEQSLRARYVILATGIMDVQPQIGGSIQPILPFANEGHALYCVRCDGHRTIGDELSVITNSSTGIYIAAMMIERYRHEQVQVLTHGASFELSDGAQQMRELYDIPIFESPIVEILGEAKKGLEGFRLEDGNIVRTNRSIISLGIIAYNELLTALGGEVDETGKALVSDSFESSVPGLFVVGDLVAGKKMQVYTSQDVAVDAADTIDRRLRARRRAALLGDRKR